MAKYGIRSEQDGAWWTGDGFSEDCFAGAAFKTFDNADRAARLLEPRNPTNFSRFGVALIPTPEWTALREITEMIDGCGDVPQNAGSLPQMIRAHAVAALQYSK